MGDAYQTWMGRLRAELSGLRVAGLKGIITTLGLPKSGTKNILLERIVTHVKSLHESNASALRDGAIATIRESLVAHRGAYAILPPFPSSAAGSVVGSSWSSDAQTSSAGTVKHVPSWSPKSDPFGAGGSSSLGTSVGSIYSLASRPPPGRKVTCICQQTHTGYNDVTCSLCGAVFHAQCYQPLLQQSAPRPAVCFTCISLRQDPFVQVQHTVLGPTKFGGRSNDEFSATFNLSQAQQSELLSAGAGRAGSMKLLLRCYPLDVAEMNKHKPSAKVPPYPPHSWPLEANLTVNGNPIAIKQRQVFYHGVSKKWKGGSEPVDVFMHSRRGLNRLQLRFRDETQYVLVLQIIRVISVDEVFKRIMHAANTPSIEEGLVRVQKSFYADRIVDSDDEGVGGDGELMATVTRLSLKCPLGLCNIETPARGKNCQHLQCFDLGTFLNFVEKSSSWKCGVCHNHLTVEDVLVDRFMLDIVEKLKQSKERDGNDDLDSIEIDYQGGWKLFSSSVAATSRKRKAEEALAAASVDVDDDGDGRAAMNGHLKPAAQPVGPPGQAQQLQQQQHQGDMAAAGPEDGGVDQVIDLSLSDDEGPLAPTAPPPPTASASMQQYEHAGTAQPPHFLGYREMDGGILVIDESDGGSSQSPGRGDVSSNPQGGRSDESNGDDDACLGWILEANPPPPAAMGQDPFSASSTSASSCNSAHLTSFARPDSIPSIYHANGASAAAITSGSNGFDTTRTATSYEQQPRPQDEQQPQPGWDDVVAKTVSNATSGDVGLDFAEWCDFADEFP